MSWAYRTADVGDTTRSPDAATAMTVAAVTRKEKQEFLTRNE